jgi:hypothetical protein
MSRGRCVKMHSGVLITCHTCYKLWLKQQQPAIKPFIETEMMGPMTCPECKKKGLYAGIRLVSVHIYCEKCGHTTSYIHERDVPKIEGSQFIDLSHPRPMLSGTRLSVAQVLAELAKRPSIEEFADDMYISADKLRGLLKDLSAWDIFKGYAHSALKGMP